MRNRYKKYKISEHKIFIGSMVVLFFLLGTVLLVGQNTVALLSPKEIIASQEKRVLVFSVSLMLLVLFPILTFAYFVAWKYRATSEKKATYSPNWDSDNRINMLKFTIPICVIIILGITTWKTSHALDPFKAIQTGSKPITIQVISLQWKWLFIYPDQNMATVNFVEVPQNTPVNFELTSDAPMNSFWIPQLGGQMYAMTGMETHLNLMATAQGDYQGSAAEINGKGFAGMRFVARAVSQSDYEQFVRDTRAKSTSLTETEYNKLSQPSENNPQAFYSSVEPNLFDAVMQKYMAPAGIQQFENQMNMHM